MLCHAGRHGKVILATARCVEYRLSFSWPCHGICRFHLAVFCICDVVLLCFRMSSAVLVCCAMLRHCMFSGRPLPFQGVLSSKGTPPGQAIRLMDLVRLIGQKTVRRGEVGSNPSPTSLSAPRAANKSHKQYTNDSEGDSATMSFASLIDSSFRPSSF